MDITFLFYNGMTALDAIGPHEVLSRVPDVTVQCVSLVPGVIQTTSGIELMTRHSLSDVTKTDILLIPGAGNATTLREYPDILEWVREIHKTTRWTTSVCTGSLILGAAGLLSGIEATSHWAVMDRLQHWGAKPTEKRVVESGKIITAAGVSAGIDMALLLASKIAGNSVAQSLQLVIEYDPEPPFDTGSPAKTDPLLVKTLREKILKRFEPDN